MAISQTRPMLSRHAVRVAGVLRSDIAPARRVHVSRAIRDPFPAADGGPHSISLSHPLDPSNSTAPSTGPPPSNSQPRNNNKPPPQSNTNDQSVNSGVPAPYIYPTPTRPTYTNPPFDTYAFFKALEKSFPTPTAQSLMRATRALLVNRIGKVRTEALSAKDLDNQAYLFRAALSELRTELSMVIKNESAAVSSATATLRRDVERLDVKMKEDIDNLKHEIQMELDSRKNESKADLKQQDIAIEELLNKAIVTISDLRSIVEEIKWENMRRAVLTLAAFVVVTIIGMEIRPKPKPKHPPTPKETSARQAIETVEGT